MTSQYAFYFDSSSCSGCKACQVACKDRHDLRTGLLWRRVYEVTGGDWIRMGEAWQSRVFAYNISISCNHCEKPVCAYVCPAGAISKREDGVVLINPDRCIGCRYCSWACPYDAPQYDARAGVMTKCDFCVEDLDVGLKPACVAACPLRALDFGERSRLESRYGVAHQVYPLPDSDLTGPALVITPHRDAPRARSDQAQSSPGRISNREEVGQG